MSHSRFESSYDSCTTTHVYSLYSNSLLHEKSCHFQHGCLLKTLIFCQIIGWLYDSAWTRWYFMIRHRNCRSFYLLGRYIYIVVVCITTYICCSLLLTLVIVGTLHICLRLRSILLAQDFGWFSVYDSSFGKLEILTWQVVTFTTSSARTAELNRREKLCFSEITTNSEFRWTKR